MHHLSSGVFRILGRLGWVTLCVLGLAGCVPNGEFVLHQPFAPPSQQNLKLTAARACHAADGDERMCALAFPLPGSAGGPRAFVVWLVFPDTLGTVPVSTEQHAGVRGFLIQELGALAGRSDFVEGTIRFQKVFLAPRQRRLDVDVLTEDGTRVTGRAVLEEMPVEVQTFQREFAADVAHLRAAESVTAEPGATATRGSAAP